MEGCFQKFKQSFSRTPMDASGYMNRNNLAQDRIMGCIRNWKLYRLLTSYAIIFGQRTFFSIMKLVFRGKREFYLFCYSIFKDRVLLK